MMILARVAVWITGLLFAVFPLGFLLAREKGLDFSLLLTPSEYDGLKRDLCFVAIAILVVGLVDAGEAILAAISSSDKSNQKQAIATVPVTVFIALEIAIFSSVCGESQSTDGVGKPLFYLFLSTFICAAATRIQLLRAG